MTKEDQYTDLAIESIRTDGGTQMRAGLNEETLSEYVEAWEELSRQRNGLLKMPPIEVYHDGQTYWLADGFHRVESYRRFLTQTSSAAPRTIRAIVHSGNRRAAILHAAKANAVHGLRRTNADKRRAVEALLRDEEWGQWSDHEIARKCKVSQPFVSKIRGELTDNGYQSDSTERTYTTKHGTTTTMNVSGQRQAASERISYAPVWMLEQAVQRAIKTFWHDDETPDVAGNLRALMNLPDWEKQDLGRAILREVDGNFDYHKRGLVQAINNVRSQWEQRQAVQTTPPDAGQRQPRNIHTRTSRLIENGWGFTHHTDGRVTVGMPCGLGDLGTFDDERAAVAAAEEAQRDRIKPQELPPDLAANCRLVSDGVRFHAQVHGYGKDPRREWFDQLVPAIAWLREQVEGEPAIELPPELAAVGAKLDQMGNTYFARYPFGDLSYTGSPRFYSAEEAIEWLRKEHELRLAKQSTPSVDDAPTQPTHPRPLTLDETKAVIWRTLRKAAGGGHGDGAAAWREWLAEHDQPEHYADAINGENVIFVGNTFQAAHGRIMAQLQPELPADLAARGWQLRRVDGTGSYWCYNADGHRATATHERVEDAIAEARAKQIDLAAETAQTTAEPPAQPCEAHQQRMAAILEEVEFWQGAIRRVERVGQLTGVYTGTDAALSRVIQEVVRLYGKELSAEQGASE